MVKISSAKSEAFCARKYFRFRSSFLRSVPNRGDDDSSPTHAIENTVRSSSDHQFPNSRFGAGAAQVGVRPQRFHQGDDPRGEALSSLWFV
jgi:hypothetical protein